MGSSSDNVAKLKTAYRQWHESKGGSVKGWLDLMVDDDAVRMRLGIIGNQRHVRPAHNDRNAALPTAPARIGPPRP